MSKFIEVKDIALPSADYMLPSKYPSEGFWLLQTDSFPKDQLVLVKSGVVFVVGPAGGPILHHINIREEKQSVERPAGVVTEAFALRLLTAAIGNTPEQLEKLLA